MSGLCNHCHVWFLNMFTHNFLHCAPRVGSSKQLRHLPFLLMPPHDLRVYLLLIGFLLRLFRKATPNRLLSPSCLRARRRRVWILRHLAMGYSVHLLRVLGPLTFDVLPTLIPGYTDHTPEGFRLRSIVFGTCERTGLGLFFSCPLPPPPVCITGNDRITHQAIVFKVKHPRGSYIAPSLLSLEAAVYRNKK